MYVRIFSSTESSGVYVNSCGQLCNISIIAVFQSFIVELC